MSIELAPTVVAVVQSDVLGRVAVSIPVEWDYTDGGTAVGLVRLEEARDRVDEQETAYIDSHTTPAPEDFFVVPSEPFRAHMEAAYAAGSDSWDTVADRIGWWRKANDRPDERRPDGQKVRYYVRQDQIPGEIARELAEAMGMEPHEAGL